MITTSEIAKAKGITIKRIKEDFKEIGWKTNFQGSTIVNDELLQSILTVKRIWKVVRRPKKSKRSKSNKKIGNPNSKPRNKMLLKNWRDYDEELRAKADDNRRAKFIRTPMGGKPG